MQDQSTAAPKRDRAEEALAEIVRMFESGDLPEAVARTTIRRQESDAPSAGWSLGNQLLCLMAGTEDARGFRQWQAVDRKVTKGAKAFSILAPSTRKIRETNDAGEEVERTAVIGFRGIPVFRLEDTDGEPLEKPDYEPAEFPPLYDVAERLGVSVRYAAHVKRFLGYYAPSRGEIVLCSHDAETFFHELAHAAHDVVLKSHGRRLQGGQHVGQEVIAETVAAVLCKLYGLDGYLWHGAEYIKHYAKADRNPARAVMRVLADVQAVLDVLLAPVEAEREREREPVRELIAA